MTISDFKARFSEVLSQVANGGSVKLLNDHSCKPIAVLSPYGKRIIGTYDGIASFSENECGKITEDEFLGLY